MADIGNSGLLHIGADILPPADTCVVIVRTTWNAAVVDALLSGCKKVLKEKGLTDIRDILVPGAFEIPFAIKRYWDVHKYKDDRPDAFIALGCVLRGDTPHFEYICQGVTEGIVQLNLSMPVPTIFGVLTVNSQEQADERTGGIHGHKGEEAAITALQMIALIQSFQTNSNA